MNKRRKHQLERFLYISAAILLVLAVVFLCVLGIKAVSRNKNADKEEAVGEMVMEEPFGENSMEETTDENDFVEENKAIDTETAQLENDLETETEDTESKESDTMETYILQTKELVGQIHFARRAEAIGRSGVVVVVEIGGDERPHLDGVRAVPFPVGAGEGIGAAAEFITFVEFRGKLGCKVDSSHNNFLSYHYVPSYQIDSNSASAVLFPLVDNDPVERALFFSSCALRAASIFCCSN